LTDDLARTEDGSSVEADLTAWLAYSTPGTSVQVELELTADHEAELAKLLARYLAAGHHPDNPGTLPKQTRPRVYHPPPPGSTYGGRGRETLPITRRFMAYARLRGVDIFHKADGTGYSNGKPYLSPTLKAEYAAFIETPEGKTWLAGLSPEDGGEG
jgi:hypothetical protein